MSPSARSVVACVLLLVAFAFRAKSQSRKTDDLALGSILVTPRDAPDPLFEHAVILLVRYADSGVVGLMVNTRTAIPVSRALQGFTGASGHSEPVFAGGPVQLEAVFALSRQTKKPDGADPVVGNEWLITSKATLEHALAGRPDERNFRVYLGYCGWTLTQLRNEVRAGGWYIFKPTEDVPFDSEPKTLWPRMIAKAEAQIVQLPFTGRAFQPLIALVIGEAR